MTITDNIIKVIEHRFAGDFKQDLYVKILEFEDELPKLDSDEDIHKWLSKIAINQHLNTSWKKYNRAFLRDEHDSDIRDTFGYNDVADDPLDIVLAKELETDLLSSLSELEVDIYARVLGNGVTYKDVATELNMSEEAVRKHVSRIKRKFNGETN